VMNAKMVAYIKSKAVKSWAWGGIGAVAIENPAEVFGGRRCFTTPITDQIISRLTEIVHKSFGAKLDESSNDGVKQHIIDSDVIIILHSDDDVLGFASARRRVYNCRRIFYIHGIAVASELKRNGASKHLRDALMEINGGNMIAFTTQSPIVYCLFAPVTKLYPSVKGKKVPREYRKLGEALVADRPGEINPETFVVKGLYDKCLYGSIPRCMDDEVNEWFDRSLEIESGVSCSGLLVIGE
jgi:hypothetical protein